MNIETGEIVQIEDDVQFNKLIESGEIIGIDNPPKPHCPSCRGCGHIGQDKEENFIPCKCLGQIRTSWKNYMADHKSFDFLPKRDREAKPDSLTGGLRRMFKTKKDKK